MKLIIAGTRTATKAQVFGALGRFPTLASRVTEVVSGKQFQKDWKTGIFYGADYWGEQWAKENGIKVIPFPADWLFLGRSAGPKRNREMAQYADALFAIWNGESRGTKNMIDEALACGLKVFIWRTDLNRGCNGNIGVT